MRPNAPKADAHQSKSVEGVTKVRNKQAELLYRENSRVPYALGCAFDRH